MSDQQKHTPGPWSPDETGVKVWSIDEHCVADCGPKRDYANGMTVCRANARLIAASPALLAACKAAREVIQYPSGKTAEQRNEVLAQLAEAIKSAEPEGDG